MIPIPLIEFKKMIKVKRQKPEDVIYEKIVKHLTDKHPSVIYHFDTGSGYFAGRTRNGKKNLRNANKLTMLNHRWSGYPDLFISEPNKMYHGLFLEIKADYNTPVKKDGSFSTAKKKQKQVRMIMDLNDRGYKSVFGVGFEQCKQIIDDYLTIPKK